MLKDRIQPVEESVFSPLTILGVLKRSDAVTSVIQWDEVTRDILVSMVLRHPIPEEAFVAGVPLNNFIEIQAGNRITEELCGFPRSTDRPAIPAAFQDVPLQFQLVYNLFEVGWHGLLASFVRLAVKPVCVEPGTLGSEQFRGQWQCIDMKQLKGEEA
jgi:hypothetical protein